MANFLYFAYGSNMLREWLTARCPSAVLRGVAVLPDGHLTFDKISRDESGKCGFEVTAGEFLPGVLWEIEQSDRAALDRAEGLGNGYDAVEVEVREAHGQACHVLTYQATRRDQSLKPYDWYKALVLAGATQQDLPPAHIASIWAIPTIADPDPQRQQRIDALRVLEAAGYGVLLQ